ncbi:MAG: hypothetical protein HN778_05840 [Prolixibacteraceae bacterium]|nr:hypothetical protein [Prolixibacteraceae bacterium]MBT6763653.1 hypothetical protein [Prolixibacteraceae bacterium]MBT7394337.1 hypothetical protein [Prolixibacteraceae bacterium]
MLKDFWDFEGEFFAYYEIARRIEIYAHSKPMDITNILLLYKDFLTPRIDINSKNFDTYFLAELKETFLERRGKICRFITLIKNKFFENKYIDFLATPKENMQIGHFIKEIEKKNPLRNQFYIKQVKTDNPKEKAKKPFLKESSKLTLRKIALINFYINKPITEDNKDEIAKQYDWKSGHKLYQHYSFYSSRANRLALPDPFTKKKYNNIIELFEKVIEHLPDNYKQKAIDEKKTIESKYNSENY